MVDVHRAATATSEDPPPPTAAKRPALALGTDLPRGPIGHAHM